MPSAPPTPTTCTSSAAVRTTLHRETERLRRMRRPRDWGRADALLDQLSMVCDLAARLCQDCAGDLAVRGRALQPICQDATRPVWTAIGLDGDIREGRRLLRRLDDEDEGQDYWDLVGQYEDAQRLALLEHPRMMVRLDNQIAALEDARTRALHADQLQTVLASDGLVQVQLRFRELSDMIANPLGPPPPRARPRR